MLGRLPIIALALVTVVGCARVEDRRAPSAEPARTERPTSAPVAAPDPPAEPPLEPREVQFPTSDGVTIAATLYPAHSPTASLAILVHQLGSTRAEWEPLVARLRRPPELAVLAIDLRGHGESTSGPHGRELAWRDFDNEAWAGTTLDVIAALDWLASEGSQVQPARIAVVGSSIGSTAAIAAAARDERARVVVALSPGRAYRGFDAITPAVSLAGRPFFAVVAEEEMDSVETARAMGRITSSEPLVVSGAAHGVAMFAAHPEVLDRVEEFLRGALATRPPE